MIWLGILKNFGYTNETPINMTGLDPRSKEARKIAATILAFDYGYLSHSALYFDEEDKVYKLDWENEIAADPGYDVLLATIASFNLGIDDVGELIRTIGPWDPMNKEEWYKKFLLGLKEISRIHSLHNALLFFFS